MVVWPSPSAVEGGGVLGIGALEVVMGVLEVVMGTGGMLEGVGAAPAAML